jgi:hypothetical protein
MTKLTEPGANTAKVIEAIPEAKLASKISKTWTGIALAGLGVILSFTSAALMIRMVWVSAPLSMWPVVFALAPLVAGVALAIIGAHHWAGELMSAALKDVGNLLAIWRKK